jgi:hypothetical protein
VDPREPADRRIVAAVVVDPVAMIDPTAMVDRATSIRVDIDGPSYRDELARRRAKDHGIVDDST